MNDTKKRSDFVTVVAWIFIVLTGFGSIISVLQNIMIRTMFPGDKMQEALSEADNIDNMPEFVRLMFENIESFFLVFLIVLLFFFVASIGLLKRKNWARITFIVLMVLGVIWNGIGILIQMAFMPTVPVTPDPEMAEQFSTMMSTMRIGSFVFVALLTGLYLWVIVKLLSKDIKEEFIETKGVKVD